MLESERGGACGSPEEVILGPSRPAALADPKEPSIDVAAVRLTSQAIPFLPTSWCDASQLADDSVVEPTDVVVLCGYPAFLAQPARTGPRQITIGLGGIVYTTGVKGTDRLGRLEVTWGEAIGDGDSPFHPKLQLDPVKPVRLGEPGGVSGGGLWRFRGTTRKTEIWAPASHGRLIGVHSAWNKRDTEYCEPVTLWSDWFRAVLAD